MMKEIPQNVLQNSRSQYDDSVIYVDDDGVLEIKRLDRKNEKHTLLRKC